jgi:hypothetical protein
MNLFLLPPIGDGPDLCNASHLAATALIGTNAAGFAALQRRALHRKVTSDPIPMGRSGSQKFVPELSGRAGMTICRRQREQ